MPVRNGAHRLLQAFFLLLIFLGASAPPRRSDFRFLSQKACPAAKGAGGCSF